MLRKFRLWLAKKILPFDAESAATIGAMGWCAWLDITGNNYIEFERCSNFRKYAFHEIGEDWEFEPITLRCDICTNEFQAGPEGPCKCPSCQSSDLSLVE